MWLLSVTDGTYATETAIGTASCVDFGNNPFYPSFLPAGAAASLAAMPLSFIATTAARTKNLVTDANTTILGYVDGLSLGTETLNVSWWNKSRSNSWSHSRFHTWLWELRTSLLWLTTLASSNNCWYSCSCWCNSTSYSDCSLLGCGSAECLTDATGVTYSFFGSYLILSNGQARSLRWELETCT